MGLDKFLYEVPLEAHTDSAPTLELFPSLLEFEDLHYCKFLIDY
jgi:hypothetical protein